MTTEAETRLPCEDFCGSVPSDRRHSDACLASEAACYGSRRAGCRIPCTPCWCSPGCRDAGRRLGDARPSHVEVGQRWTDRGGGRAAYTVVARDGMGHWRLRWDDGDESDGWYDSTILHDTYLGTVPAPVIAPGQSTPVETPPTVARNPIEAAGENEHEWTLELAGPCAAPSPPEPVPGARPLTATERQCVGEWSQAHLKAMHEAGIHAPHLDPNCPACAAAPAPLEPVKPEPTYPCADCGVLRTKAEGGTTFTVCDECWDKHCGKPSAAPAPGVGEGRPDPVNHPPHYNAGGMEAIDVIEAFGLGFCLGNTVKYVLRAGRKGDAIEDLKKARWYLERELALLGAEAGK